MDVRPITIPCLRDLKKLDAKTLSNLVEWVKALERYCLAYGLGPQLLAWGFARQRLAKAAKITH